MTNEPEIKDWDAEVDQARANLLDLADELLPALNEVRRFYRAGMEAQLEKIQKTTRWSRERILEVLATKGSTWGFPEMSMEEGDPFDLENWVSGLRAVNDIMAEIEAISEDEDDDPLEF